MTFEELHAEWVAEQRKREKEMKVEIISEHEDIFEALKDLKDKGNTSD
jgi:hypothetical protein